MINAGLAQYKTQSINTMSQGELVSTLYEGALKNLKRAVLLYDNNDFDLASVSTEKAKKIFDHLILSLDFSFDLSDELFKLYNFFKQEIISAEVKRKSNPINEIIPLITDLNNTWVEAQKLSHIAK